MIDHPESMKTYVNTTPPKAVWINFINFNNIVDQTTGRRTKCDCQVTQIKLNSFRTNVSHSFKI